MIPIRDVVPSRTTPFVTLSLIILNVLAFLYEVTLPPGALQPFIDTYALIPADLGLATSLSLISSMFLHGDWGHLIGNMVFLWIFGDNVEDRFGHGRYLLFYLVAGMFAALAQVIVSPQSTLPIIGASGAIAAAMGAYFVLFPRSRVVMLIWLVFYIDFVEIPAVLFLGFWFLYQLIGGLDSFALDGGKIAFFAHLGGFAVGALLGRMLARPERAEVGWWDQQPAR
jgi:membrane associated rhomboid family serine protease